MAPPFVLSVPRGAQRRACAGGSVPGTPVLATYAPQHLPQHDREERGACHSVLPRFAARGHRHPGHRRYRIERRDAGDRQGTAEGPSGHIVRLARVTENLNFSREALRKEGGSSVASETSSQPAQITLEVSLKP